MLMKSTVDGQIQNTAIDLSENSYNQSLLLVADAFQMTDRLVGLHRNYLHQGTDAVMLDVV